MSSDNSLGVFEEQVMLAVLHAREDAYGMNVRREIETRTDRDVAIGAVYATLDRLEAKGMVSSQLGPGTPVRGGRPKRHYRIEAKGLRALHAVRDATARLWEGIRLPVKGTT